MTTIFWQFYKKSGTFGAVLAYNGKQGSQPVQTRSQNLPTKNTIPEYKPIETKEVQLLRAILAELKKLTEKTDE